VLFRIALALHLIGVILWIGGAIAAATVAASASAEKDSTSALAGARRALLFWATPGMLVAWLGGLGMLLPNFMDMYARAGWMHTKLTLLLAASAVMGVLTGRVRKAARSDKPASAGLLNGLAGALLLMSIAVVGLAILKPGA